jgi:acetolactate synthase I/II/III large subunit
MNAAHALVQALLREGADLVFGYPGGAVLPIYDALYGSALRHILVRHEQAAAMAADGYARASGKVGVCLATSGPGATNLVTGIANAYLDSVPMVAITGQAPTGELGRDAFQEVDVLGITMPIVKHSYLVLDPSDLARTVHEAFQIARSGRPGPVVIDVPKDILLADAGDSDPWPLQDEEPRQPSQGQLEKASLLLDAARAPLVYAGGGVGLACAVDEFREFIESTGVPSVLTLKGLGNLPEGHPQLLGMLGMHGSKAANLAVQECDLLICVGARFDDRVTGKLERFAPNAKVVHLDIDVAEVGKRRKPDAPVVGDIRSSLRTLSEAGKLDLVEWHARCVELSLEDGEKSSEPPPNGWVQAPRFLRDLGLQAEEGTVVSSDVGQHQMWVAQYYPVQHPSQHLTSGGLGAMGYGLPAAIGAQFAHPDRCVINVSGDGGIMMNIQELATIKRYSLPVKVVVMDNQRLGMVRQWQELFLGERYSEVDLSDNPDFVQVAEAFGIPSIRVSTAAEARLAIHLVHTEPGPLLVHVVLNPAAMVWPIVPPGCSNAEMMEAK